MFPTPCRFSSRPLARVVLVALSCGFLLAAPAARAAGDEERDWNRRARASAGVRGGVKWVTGPQLNFYPHEMFAVEVSGGTAGLIYGLPAPYAADASLLAVFDLARPPTELLLRAGGGGSVIGVRDHRTFGGHALVELAFHMYRAPFGLFVDYRPVLFPGAELGWSPWHVGMGIRFIFND